MFIFRHLKKKKKTLISKRLNLSHLSVAPLSHSKRLSFLDLPYSFAFSNLISTSHLFWSHPSCCLKTIAKEGRGSHLERLTRCRVFLSFPHRRYKVSQKYRRQSCSVAHLIQNTELTQACSLPSQFSYFDFDFPFFLTHKPII